MCLLICFIVDSMTAWHGIEVYRATTSRLKGYVYLVFVLVGRFFRLSISWKLCLRCAGMYLRIGLRMFVSSQTIFVVGPLTFETIGRIFRLFPFLCVLIKW